MTVLIDKLIGDSGLLLCFRKRNRVLPSVIALLCMLKVFLTIVAVVFRIEQQDGSCYS